MIERFSSRVHLQKICAIKECRICAANCSIFVINFSSFTVLQFGFEPLPSRPVYFILSVFEGASYYPIVRNILTLSGIPSINIV